MTDRIASGLAPIEQFLERVSVDAVFGKPTQAGDTTIIPVADVYVMFGYGAGSGPQDAGEPDPHAPAAGGGAGGGAWGGAGGGAGGGAVGKAAPRGYLRVTPDGVTFEPTIDPMRIALSGMALGAWAIFWITKTIMAFAKKGKQGK